MTQPVNLQSEVSVLKQQNEILKKQLIEQNKGVEGLLAQLDATRQTLNEAMNGAITIRTHLSMAQKQNQELNNVIDALKKEIENLRNQLIQKPENDEVIKDAINSQC